MRGLCRRAVSGCSHLGGGSCGGCPHWSVTPKHGYLDQKKALPIPWVWPGPGGEGTLPFVRLWCNGVLSMALLGLAIHPHSGLHRLLTHFTQGFLCSPQRITETKTSRSPECSELIDVFVQNVYRAETWCREGWHGVWLPDTLIFWLSLTTYLWYKQTSAVFLALCKDRGPARWLR